MRFTVVDLETANARMHSICQIGAVRFENGEEISATSMYVDPQDYFDGINVSIHGIDETTVAGAKTFPEISSWITETTRDEIVVCHTHFDRVALAQACAFHQLDALTCRWLDSARIVRRAWPKYARRGYGLSNVCSDFGIAFQHHDALQDARAAGLIVLRAISETSITLEEWFDRVKQPLIPFLSSEPNQSSEDSGISGESVVFTGSLQIVRGEAAMLARAAGMAVEDGVTKKTTLLVVGDQDVARLGGKEKSSKHLKAEGMIIKGHKIRIIQESDFMALVRDVGTYACAA